MILRARKLEEICQHPIFCGVFFGGGGLRVSGGSQMFPSAPLSFQRARDFTNFVGSKTLIAITIQALVPRHIVIDMELAHVNGRR